LIFHPRSNFKRITKRIGEEKLYYFSDGIRNHLRKWSFHKSVISESKLGATSISDYSEYSEFCELASQDKELFSKFRSCIEYQEILEHVTRSLGNLYLNEIKNNSGSISKVIELASDDIGKPIKFNYQGVGRVSPTQLRYYKVLLDLQKYFGRLDGYKVVEVGIGYGGQSSQICKEFKVSNYTLIDLPSVLKLARNYLDLRAPNSPISYGHFNHGEVDLFISNYAFSELRRDIQNDYFEKYVSKARRGYVTYNHITPEDWGSFTAVEFANKIKGSEIIAEEPNTGKGNVIVLWGHKQS
jgi:hypothetical protein